MSALLIQLLAGKQTSVYAKMSNSFYKNYSFGLSRVSEPALGIDATKLNKGD